MIACILKNTPLAMLVACSALSAEIAQKTSEATVDLSPYSITAKPDLPTQENWKYARIDGFEVLSNIPEHKAQELLKDFQQFRQAIDMVTPIPKQPEARSTLILCDKTKDFRTFIPEKLKDEYGIVSHLLRDSEKSAIVMDLDTTALKISELSTRNTIYGRFKYLEVSPRKQLYRELTRYQLPKDDSAQPAWLLEGVTQILQDMRISSREMQYGRIGRTYRGMSRNILSPRNTFTPASTILPGEFSPYSGGGWINRINLNIEPRYSILDFQENENEPVAESSFFRSLEGGRLMPFEAFLSVNADDSEALNPMKHLLWANQAYAFVHMCRFGIQKKYKESLDIFQKRLANEPLSEALFVECFGVNYEKMRKILAGYIRIPRSYYHTITLAKDRELASERVDFREATPSEIARIKGDAQSMAGNHATALQTYREAYERGVRDPELMAAQGVCELKQGHTENARKTLEAVAIIDSDRPSVWTSLAKLRLEEAITNSQEQGKLSASQMNFVLAPVLKTLILEPKTADTFHLIAEAWENSAVTINAVYVNLLGEGALQFPHDSRLTLRVAKLYESYGDKENAAVFANLGLRYAKNEPDKKLFQSMIQSLPPLPYDLQTASN